MNILDLQKELDKQIKLLQKELNDYLIPLGCTAILANNSNGFRFNIESDSGEDLGYFEDFSRSGKENNFKDEYYYHCKVIVDSYSEI